MEDENYYLIPEVFEKSNQFYVDCLENAVEKEGVHNIALLGGYSTGKSSILKQFSKGRRNVRYVSLLHIGEFKNDIVDMGKNKSEDEDEVKVKVKNDKYSMEKVRREIFAQLFYKFKPNELRSSSFSRVGRTLGWNGALYISVFIFAMVALISEVASSLSSGLIGVYQWYLNDMLLMFSLSIVLAYTGGRLIKFFDVKKISLSKFILENAELNFLEQTRDEIINIFRDRPVDYLYSIIRKRRLVRWLCKKNLKFTAGLCKIIKNEKIVVFEDLDRFNDYEIYVALRQLNFLINESDAVRKKVVFIYALRDSIIENPDERNKLFDYVLPVVPFRVAYDYADKLINEVVKIFSSKKKKLTLSNELVIVCNVVSENVTNERVFCGFCQLLRSMAKFKSDYKDDLTQVLILAGIRYFYPGMYEDFSSGRGEIIDLYKKIVELKESAFREFYLFREKLAKNKESYEDNAVVSRMENGDHGVKKENGFYRDIIMNSDKSSEIFDLYKYLGDNKKINNCKILQSFAEKGLIKDEMMLTLSNETGRKSLQVKKFLANYRLNIKNPFISLGDNDIKYLFNKYSNPSQWCNKAFMNKAILGSLLSKREMLNDMIGAILYVDKKEAISFCFDFAIGEKRYEDKSDSYSIMGSVACCIVLELLYKLDPDSMLIELEKRHEKVFIVDMWSYCREGVKLDISGWRIGRLSNEAVISLSRMMPVFVSRLAIEDLSVLMDKFIKLSRADLFDIDYSWLKWINLNADEIKERCDVIFNSLVDQYDLIGIDDYTQIVKYGVENKKKFAGKNLGKIMVNISDQYKEVFKKYIESNTDI